MSIGSAGSCVQDDDQQSSHLDGGFSRPSAESPVVRVGYLGHENVWEVFIRRRTGGEGGGGGGGLARRRGKKKQDLSCVPTGYPRTGVRGCSSPIKPRETERERGRAPSIFASLFQAEAG
ncbi:Uncharacterized protein DBV15_10540 [Temnothorax longispinosus]|uniref:Uncharacterized protein n=1 Tax=Temnothorax longispinosus TaxID=300112 RepID=A0A4S2L2W5_9HYME|nr:Uncharacterized protein DBV15_10540 [Temnothorax longispinosus]